MWLAEASSREMLRSLDGVKAGAIIEISAHTTRAKPSDRLIAEIAAKSDGLYSAEIHRAAVPTDRAAFITTMCADWKRWRAPAACSAKARACFASVRIMRRSPRRIRR
jgi:hypothetical protein